MRLINRCKKTRDVTKKPQVAYSRTPKKRAVCKSSVKNALFSADNV
jgi:hypothetical protein